LREIAVQHYRPIAEQLAPDRQPWTTATPRELLDRVEPGAREELGALTGDVEDAAYGAAAPTSDRVDEIGARANRVARTLTGEDRR
jgi:hypothetical protein